MEFQHRLSFNSLENIPLSSSHLADDILPSHIRGQHQQQKATRWQEHHGKASCCRQNRKVVTGKTETKGSHNQGSAFCLVFFIHQAHGQKNQFRDGAVTFLTLHFFLLLLFLLLSLNVLPLKPGAGQYTATRATLTARDFFLDSSYPSGPSTCISFPKPLPISPVLAVANT